MQTELPFWEDEGMRELAGELLGEGRETMEDYN